MHIKLSLCDKSFTLHELCLYLSMHRSWCVVNVIAAQLNRNHCVDCVGYLLVARLLTCLTVLSGLRASPNSCTILVSNVLAIHEASNRMPQDDSAYLLYADFDTEKCPLSYEW